MNETSADTKAETRPQRDAHLSKDGKWRAFPKVPGLLQYVSTGTYFARVKVKGKFFRKGLDTTVFTNAKLKLADFKKEQAGPQIGEGTVGEALASYRESLGRSYELSETTKTYRKHCVTKLLNSWPGLEKWKLRDLTAKECKKWANALQATEIDAQYFNNVLGTLRAILRAGGVPVEKDPTRAKKGDPDHISKMGVRIEKAELPSADKWAELLNHMDNSSAWRTQRAADMVRFLAYSGCRIQEARKVTWADVDKPSGFITVQNSKLRNHSNHSATRRVPVIPPMRELLDRLKKANPQDTDRVIPFADCEIGLRNACEAVGVPKLTHHSLRHWFATFAIQQGVDVPTVADWLGHHDDGALLLKRYRHGDEKHSLTVAAKLALPPAAKAA